MIQFLDLPKDLIERCVRPASTYTKLNLSWTNRWFSQLVQQKECWDGITEMPVEVIIILHYLEIDHWLDHEHEEWLKNGTRNRILIAAILKKYPFKYERIHPAIQADRSFIQSLTCKLLLRNWDYEKI